MKKLILVLISFLLMISIGCTQKTKPVKQSAAIVIEKIILHSGITFARERFIEVKTDTIHYDFVENEFTELGYRLIQQGKFAEAIEVYKMNIELFPNSVNTYESLGESYIITGNYDFALENYRKALQLDPNLMSAKRGLLYLMSFADSDENKGRVIADKVHSKGLESNLLGDSPDVSVIIYLPPGYKKSPQRHYPAVYLLHGYGGNNRIWLDGGYQDFNIKNAMDSLIVSGKVKEMIIVMPNAYNKYRGSWYGNSSVTGNWERFITKELIAYIDSNYRTLTSPKNRGITGHSMGGLGAVRYAFFYPGIFNAVYAMSAGTPLVSEYHFKWFMDVIEEEKLQLPDWKNMSIADFYNLHWVWKTSIAVSSAYAPNPNNPPFFVDFPFVEKNGKIQIDETVLHKWRKNDPLVIIDSMRETLIKLNIRFDVGTSDRLLFPNRIFAKKLSDAKIPYLFEEYKGDHINQIHIRLLNKVLPFFSEVLSFE